MASKTRRGRITPRVLREAMGVWAQVVHQPDAAGLGRPSRALRRELDRSARSMVRGPDLPDRLAHEVVLGIIRMVALPAHQRAQSLARAAGDGAAYWLSIALDPRGACGAVLGLTLYRALRDTGMLDEIGNDWLASADRVREVLSQHPGLTVEEAQLLVRSDPSLADHEGHVFERALRTCGIA